MNPLTNRWAALLAVAGVLLLVAELVGTDEQGGVLSQAAGASAAPAGGEPPADVPVVAAADIPVIDAEETPEEDLPQVVLADSDEIDDAEDGPVDTAFGSEPDDMSADAVSDEVVEEDTGDE